MGSISHTDILGNKLVEIIVKETNANEDITELTFEFEEILSIIKNKFSLKFVEGWYSNFANNYFSSVTI